jgi:outer membrane receptor protein involved in Fe transport
VAQFYLDASLYYNAYTNLRTGEQRPNVLVTSPVRHIEVPLMISNRRDAFTYGGELVASWEVLTNWKLSASYDYCYIDLDADKDSTNAVALTQDPHHQFKITSSTNLPGNINLDVDFFYVDKLEDGSAPSQFLLNTRLAWQPLADLELSLVGSHLLNPTVKEFGRDDLRQNNSEIPRSIYGQISWRF